MLIILGSNVANVYLARPGTSNVTTPANMLSGSSPSLWLKPPGGNA